MFGKLHPETSFTQRSYLVKTLSCFSNSGNFLCIGRFPIKQSIIDEMPNFLDDINGLLVSASIKPVSLQDIINLQRITAIEDKKILLDEFINLENSNMPLALWLYAYLENRIPTEIFDQNWTDAYHDNAMSLINN